MAVLRWIFAIASVWFTFIGVETDVYEEKKGKWVRKFPDKRKQLYNLIAIFMALIYIVLVLLTKRNIFFFWKTSFLLGIIMLIYSGSYMDDSPSFYIRNRKLAKFLKVFWVGIVCILIGSIVYYFYNLEKFTVVDTEITTYTISTDYQEDNENVAFGSDTFLPEEQNYLYYKSSGENKKLKSLGVTNPEINIIERTEEPKVVIEHIKTTYKGNDLLNAVMSDQSTSNIVNYKLYLYADTP